MSIEAMIPTALVLSSALAGIVSFLLPEERSAFRSAAGLAAAVINVGLASFVVLAVSAGVVFEARLPLAPGLDLVLQLDSLAVLFVALSSGLWLLTTIYAIGYIGGGEQSRRFFGFFGLCISATAGIAMAGSLLTFLIFYEALTLFTYPLVVHYGTKAALRAGTIYLSYMLPSSTLMLAGMIWLAVLLGGDVEFATAQQRVADVLDQHAAGLTAIFFMIAAGMSAKAAIVPLHAWLPEAMVAPAPVSALLHAVAVVKAGAFGIVRLIYDVYGGAADVLGVAQWLAAAAAVTIIYGSLRALMQDDLKRRLAFSTISQLSYIALGTAIGGPIALAGAVVHLVHQGVMKITMFFCAGAFDHTVGVKKVSEMAGIGWRMPWTMGAFSIAAIGMIGLPPMAGFISKWYLATGALAVGQSWVVGLLLVSSLLNAAYFLPILHQAWFRPPPAGVEPIRCEAKPTLLVPPLVTAVLTLLLGLLAGVPGSPLSWARLIASREFLL